MIMNYTGYTYYSHTVWRPTKAYNKGVVDTMNIELGEPAPGSVGDEAAEEGAPEEGALEEGAAHEEAEEEENDGTKTPPFEEETDHDHEDDEEVVVEDSPEHGEAPESSGKNRKGRKGQGKGKGKKGGKSKSKQSKGKDKRHKWEKKKRGRDDGNYERGQSAKWRRSRSSIWREDDDDERVPNDEQGAADGSAADASPKAKSRPPMRGLGIVVLPPKHKK